MNASDNRRAGLGALSGAVLASRQWRLLLLWLAFLLLPTAMVALPAWRALAGLLDQSVHSRDWAAHFQPLMFDDLARHLFTGDSGDWLNGAGLLALAVSLLLGPLLAGMTVAAGRAGRVLAFSQLLQSGVIEYGRMFRVLLWSLLPYAVAIAIGVVAFGIARNIDQHAVLQSRADRAQHIALAVMLVLLAVANIVVESARAAFIADPGLRSATRALGRGFMQMLRRPLGTLLGYLVVGLIGYGLALLFGILRLNTTAVGIGGFLLALLFAELAVLAIGWTRVARLFVLGRVADTLRPARG